jgi:hypothetical protein
MAHATRLVTDEREDGREGRAEGRFDAPALARDDRATPAHAHRVSKAFGSSAVQGAQG